MESGEKHVYVVGMDNFNLQEINHLRERPEYENCRFYPLLSYRELGQTEAVSFNNLLNKARDLLENADTHVHAIMTFWDFPAQTLAPILCKELGLPTRSVRDVEKCEHKLWSRQLQREHVLEATPRFTALNPFTENGEPPDLDFPFWLKPVMSFSSYLAYRVDSPEAYQQALAQLRENINRVARPYNESLEHLDLPEEIARIDGCWCIAEEIIKGEQCTVEGYAFDGEVTVHGIIDSVHETTSSSFARYQYPSHLPEKVQKEMENISRRFIQGIDYRHGDFNIEFFHDKETGDLKILEVNPRISQSHSELFGKVDGLSNEAIPVSLALGEKPDFPHRQGKRKMAAKFYLRAHEDAFVRTVPDRENIEEIRSRYPDVEIKIVAKEGSRLSDDRLNDSYSYELAELFVGADKEEDLLEIYRKCVRMMKFELEGTDENISQLIGEKYQPPVDRPSQ